MRNNKEKSKKVALDKTSGTEPETAAQDFKNYNKAAARDALNRVHQELATREIEEKVKLSLENERTQALKHPYWRKRRHRAA